MLSSPDPLALALAAVLHMTQRTAVMAQGGSFPKWNELTKEQKWEVAAKVRRAHGGARPDDSMPAPYLEVLRELEPILAKLAR